MSLPKRHSLSSAFRRNSSYNPDLRIDTSEQLNSKNTPRSPSRVRQRLSSIFRSTSPVVSSLKDTFNTTTSTSSTPSLVTDWTKSYTNKRMSTLSLFKINEPVLEDDNKSASSDNSDRMPASPTEWETVGVPYSTYNNSSTEKKPKPAIALAYHVNRILGSTIEQVDEEIDQLWEESRKRLLIQLNQ